MQNTLDNWVGKQLDNGRYELESLLGKGGMGAVFLAVDTRLKTRVVVKVPNPTLLADEGFALRFSREIRSLVELDHPHIVKIGDVGEHEGIPYLVMSYLGGGSLEDRQVRLEDDTCEPMDPAQLRGWVPHVANALDFIHAKGYLHRDIKPGNIIFDSHGHVFLGDFGIAKAMHSDEKTQANLTQAGVVGTLGFIAPEIMVGKEYDGHVDQYSLAVVIHELLSGKRLFDGTNLFAVINQQTKRAARQLIDLVPTIDPALSKVLKRALSRNPDRRYPNCTAFSNALVKTLPAGPAGKTKPPPRRTPPSAQTATNQRPAQPTANRPPANRQQTLIEKPGQKPQGSAGMTMIEQPNFVDTVRHPRPGSKTGGAGGSRPSIQSVIQSTVETPEGRKRLYWGLGIGGGVLLLITGVVSLACLVSYLMPSTRYESGTLGSGDETLNSGEYMDRYEFEGESGQKVTVRLTSDDFAPYVMLDGPAGQRAENDHLDGDQNVSAIQDVELNATGVHEVLVTSYRSGETGDYELEIEVE